MIGRTIHDLRSPNWTPVNESALLDRVRHEQRSGFDTWKLVPWQRMQQPPMRSYLLAADSGELYAIFIRRQERLGGPTT